MHFLPCSKENPSSSVLRENALFPFRLSNYLDKRQRQYCLLQKKRCLEVGIPLPRKIPSVPLRSLLKCALAS